MSKRAPADQQRRPIAGPITQIAAGLFFVIAALLSVWGVWDSVTHGHPLLPLLAALFLILGLALIAWAGLRLLRPSAAGFGGRRGLARAVSVVTIVIVSLGIPAAGLLAWSRPVPPDSVAFSAISELSAGDGVRFVQGESWIELRPSRSATSGSSAETGTALLFWPGRPVDARAYAAILEPVAEAGVLVVIPQVPLGAAVLPTGQADQIMSAHPGVHNWIAGGHSMGGLAAVTHATGTPHAFAGVILWGSYPITKIPEDLPILLVLGTRDPFADPADLDAYTKLLPSTAKVVTVAGSNHGTFGDYGPQVGDRSAIGSRSQHREEIIDATVGFVTSVARG